MRNALDGPTSRRRDRSQAVQITEEPSDRSLDRAGFVTTHSVQKSTGDQGVNVGFGYLKQVAAKSTLPTFAHSLHAERAGAAVFERTGCSCGLRNRDHKQFIKDRQLNRSIIPDFELFVTTYRAALDYSLSILNPAGDAAMKGVNGIILRIGAVVFGAAAYVFIGIALAAAG